MRLLTFAAAAAAFVVVPASAQTAGFPEKDRQMRIVVPFAAGGGVDNAARLLGEQLRRQYGLTVIVDNRAGASGTVGGNAVRTAAADGYTLLLSASTHVLARQVLATPPYDPQTDFAPVARVGEAPLLMVVAPQRKESKLSEVVDSARREPGKWNVAIPAMGAASHLGTLLFAKQANLKFTYVPYKGTQPAMVDLGGGHIDLMMDSMVSILPLAKAGKVKPIAISSKKRSTLAPDIPTAQESGFPDFSYVTWYGVWAPKDTAPDRVAALNTMINSAMTELAKSGALASLGIEAVSETPEQFRRFIAADVKEGAELLRAAGFKAE